MAASIPSVTVLLPSFPVLTVGVSRLRLNVLDELI
jgi:hypothetical protein